MAGKMQFYSRMAAEAAEHITDSYASWTGFLKSAGNLCKYSYEDQLMIYTQRPDATAVAEYDLWNQRMHRYVKRGAKGIALIDTGGDYPKLRYVFDISDTGERRNSRPVPHWVMRSEHEQPVIEALSKRFDVPANQGYVEDQFQTIAEKLAQEYWDNYQRDILGIVDGSFLEDYDEFNIEVSFKRAAANSALYQLIDRSLGDADGFLSYEDFTDVYNFNTRQAANALGCAVNSICAQVFREIERAIARYDRQQELAAVLPFTERSDDGRDHVHEERGLSVPGHSDGDGRNEAAEQVRQDAQDVSEGGAAGAVQRPGADGKAVSPSLGDPGNGGPAGGADHDRAASGGPGTGQEDGSAGLDGAHEHPEGTGGGNRDGGADYSLTQEENNGQLSFLLFPTEQEQIGVIDSQTEKEISQTRAESEKPSAFSASEEEIDRILHSGSGFENGKLRIAVLYEQENDAKERADYLKQEYGTGGRSWIFEDEEHGFVDYSGKGLFIRKYGFDQEQRLTWTEVEKRISRLIEADEYLTDREKEQLAELKGRYAGSDGIPLPSPCHRFPPIEERSMDEEVPGPADEVPVGGSDEAANRDLNKTADYVQDEAAEHDTEETAEHSAEGDGAAQMPGAENTGSIEASPVQGDGIEAPKALQRPTATRMADALQAGDTVYLDEKPFHVESVGLFDVEMTDPSMPLPIFRTESKERLEGMLAQDERNSWLKEYVIEIVPAEAEHAQSEDVSDDGTAQMPAYEVEDTNLADASADFDELLDQAPISVSIGDEWQTFPNAEAAEEAIAEAEKQNISEDDDLKLKSIVLELNPDREPVAEPEPEPVTEEPAAPQIPVQNFHITDDHLGEGGPKQKFRMNMDAIYLLKTLESENRNASPKEQEILSRYVGWGGLSDAFDENRSAWADEYQELKSVLTEEEYAAARGSTLNAHYTSPTVIRAIYDAVGQMGFAYGNILEPSMGVGNFFGLLPEEMGESRLYGVELDSVTGRIAQKLYPEAEIMVAGFETTDRRDFYDLAVGNVPFGNYKVSDKPYDRLGFSIHDYFFAKALDQVRPGGVIAFVTSRYTLDAKSPDARQYLAQRAEFLGAIRLPNNAFKANAGTEVVSDIIFLQKREHPIDIDQDWIHLGLTDDGFAINSYFIDHPEMVLGELTAESTQYGREDCTVNPIPGADLGTQLQEAISNIHGSYQPLDLTEEDDLTRQGDTIPADPRVKNFSYTVVDGNIYFRENSIMRPVELSEKASGRIKGMVALRQIVNELIAYQLEDYPEETIRSKQHELNAAYDTFTKDFGLINSRANSQAFADDSSYYLLCSLENLDEDGQLESKADMFTKRTIRPECTVTSVDTPAEALAVSIGERGKVDLPYMADLLGTPGDYAEIITDLQGVIFKDPAGKSAEEAGWQTADEYLSGNVREKLRMAQLAAASDSRFSINVEALTKAQPKDLDASEIDVRLGATWLDADDIRQFMIETFEPPFWTRRNIEVKFSPMTAEWQITGKTATGRNDVYACVTYGTGRANAYKILEDTLNLRDVRIYDTEEDIDGNKKRVLNKKETTLAQQKQCAIKDAFAGWVWKDPYRRERLVKRYNTLFNSTRPREYDGSHIRFGGMNPDITLREHQKNAIAHVIYGGNTLLAHEVGAGKTFEMAASAMESKRLGLCQKSLFVVPNHLTLQWANEFLRLYPSAKLLVASKKDFETTNRKKFCARIATGDYDAVIIGHSQFEKIPISAERQERLLREQIDEIEDAIAELKYARGERFSIKQMEKSRKSLQTKLDKLMAADRKDDVITFEQLGVDRLFIDEAHAFKNLFLYTKMRNVAGLSTSEAQKSSDMFMKCQYMDELTGGRGIVFATGTPVSNSMTELYTMMRYLQYGTLKEKSLTHFDAWASTFGETTTAIELAPEGTGYRARTRFAKFFNLPELMNMFKEVADIKTADQLQLPVPEAKFETIVVQPSEFQQEMVAELSERAAAVHAGAVDPSQDNMLKITSDGRKIGLDQRLMNPLLPDDPDSKLNACVNNVLKIYHEGDDRKLTQLLFCDMSTPKNDGTFSVYDDIKAKLIAAGVPEEEVAFIHTADTEAKKKELFAKVRTGQVRVLLGSTQKMGAGTNVQDRLIAVHHLDVGWRPADMTQRNGRIIRQGNMNPEVQIYNYVTNGTFDAYLFQTLENKQKFISQIMTSKSPVRSCDDVDEQALSYAEIKALCAGDPNIREKMDLDVEVARLKVLKADHQSQQYRLEDKLIKYFPAEIEMQKGFIRGFEADIVTARAHPVPEDGFSGIEINGQMYTEKADAGEALLAACKESKSKEPVPLGTYRGFRMELSFDTFSKEFQIALKGEMTHRVSLGTSALGNLTRLDNALSGIPKRLEKANQTLEGLYAQQDAAKVELGKPFPQEAELTAKSARLAELDAMLNMDERGGMECEIGESEVSGDGRASVLAELKSRTDQITPPKKSKQEEVL